MAIDTVGKPKPIDPFMVPATKKTSTTNTTTSKFISAISKNNDQIPNGSNISSGCHALEQRAS